MSLDPYRSAPLPPTVAPNRWARWSKWALVAFVVGASGPCVWSRWSTSTPIGLAFEGALVLAAVPFIHFVLPRLRIW